MRAVLVLVLVAGCHRTGSSQSFADGVQAICDLPAHVPDDGQRYDARLAAAAAWADQHVTNPDARKLGDVKSLAANRQALAAAVKQAGLARCTLLDNGMELQSFADAMRVVCAAHRGVNPDYFTSHLLNTEVIRLLATLGDLAPEDQHARLRDAAARAHLASCAVLDQVVRRAAAALPEAPAGHLDPVSTGPTVAITDAGIVVDGKAVLALDHGAIAAADLEGGAHGLLAPRLREFLTALAKQLGATGQDGALPDLHVSAVPGTRYDLLMRVLYTARKAGWQYFALVVHAGDSLGQLPVMLPESHATAADPHPPGAPGALGIAVSVTAKQLALWSFSGEEGTLKQPELEVAPDRAADLQPALADIEARHHLADADRQIIVIADADTAVQRLVQLVAAVRADATGKPLFPDVVLSSGFQ